MSNLVMKNVVFTTNNIQWRIWPGDTITFFYPKEGILVHYMEGTNTIWMCSNCSQTYDTSIQDVPIKDMTKVKVYPELDRYPTYDAEDQHSYFGYLVR
ncbi:MAG: hypothetical protein WA941_07155 [Nitrososphaeraceae archaeon]